MDDFYKDDDEVEEGGEEEFKEEEDEEEELQEEEEQIIVEANKSVEYIPKQPEKKQRLSPSKAQVKNIRNLDGEDQQNFSISEES